MPDMHQNSVETAKKTMILVVCVGNDLIADDALGFEVYKRLETEGLPGHVRLEFLGVGGLALLDLLTGNERVLMVVDAVQFGAAAGTVHCLPWDRIPSLGGSAISVHDIGLKETIEIGQALYPEKMPPSIILVGIEGRCFNRMREAMTPETEAAAEKALEFIRNLFRNN